jgi:hypothetical protein
MVFRHQELLHPRWHAVFTVARSPSLHRAHCTYTHLSDTVQTVYKLPSLPNKTFTQIGVLRIVDWIFIVGAQGWW